jgi:methyl-accepting chemotaxis protein
MKLQTTTIMSVATLLILFGGAIIIVIFSVIQPVYLERLSHTTMLTMAGALAYELRLDLHAQDQSRFVQVVQPIIEGKDVYGVAVYDDLGELRFSSFDTLRLPQQLEPLIHYQAIDTQQTKYLTETVRGTLIHTLYYPLRDGDTIVGVLRLMCTFESLRQYRRNTFESSLLMIGGAILTILLLLTALLSQIFKRIQAVTTTMETMIRSRDFTQRTLIASQDEIGKLGQVFHKITERLLHLTHEIQQAGQRLKPSVTHITDAAQSHQHAAEALLTASEDVNRKVEALKHLTEQIDQKAGAVVSNAEYTLNNTIHGMDMVDELVAEMTEIDAISRDGVQHVVHLLEKAGQIAEIITIIDDMTANTKLIAFNATVEAARAGDAGRGFSVVAIEIRNLADSIGVATGNIRTIIQDIQEATHRSARVEARERDKVERGMRIVTRTKEHLDLVLHRLDETVAHAREISLATEEQNAATDRILGNMHTFLAIAHTTRTSSAETAAAVKELERLGAELRTTVAQFRLE